MLTPWRQSFIPWVIVLTVAAHAETETPAASDDHPAIVPAAEPTVPRPFCRPEPPARDLAMSAGSEVFHVLTAGAPPNSSITLRIDNRTTVTITVNADPNVAGCCVPPDPGAAPPSSGSTPAPLTGGPPNAAVVPAVVIEPALWPPEWAAKWANARSDPGSTGTQGTTISGTEALRVAKHADNHGELDLPIEFLNNAGWPRHRSSDEAHRLEKKPDVATPVSSGSGQTVILEPSTTVLLVSGIGALVMLARRRG